MAIDDTEWAGNLIIIILDRKFTTSFDNYSDEIFTVESRLPFMHCLMYSGSPTLPKHQIRPLCMRIQCMFDYPRRGTLHLRVRKDQAPDNGMRMPQSYLVI